MSSDFTTTVTMTRTSRTSCVPRVRWTFHGTSAASMIAGGPPAVTGPHSLNGVSCQTLKEVELTLERLDNCILSSRTLQYYMCDANAQCLVLRFMFMPVSLKTHSTHHLDTSSSADPDQPLFYLSGQSCAFQLPSLQIFYRSFNFLHATTTFSVECQSWFRYHVRKLS